MPLTYQHRKQITALFCIIFYALMLFKWSSGLFLFQLQPIIFNTRFDLFTWLLMQTGLHQWLINSPAGLLIFDIAFYSLPLIYWLTFLRSLRLANTVAIVMLVVNFVYIQCYTLYPTNSIESYTAWLLFPILLMMINLRSFYFMLQGLRYFFLFVFASAGIWKFIQLGIFNTSQMSGVLLYQHKELLVSSPDYWYSVALYWVINHPLIGYIIYIAGTLLELTFIAGFFTKKFDRWLAIFFIIFIVLDLMVMRIYYWELSPFLLTLIYSKYKLPVNDKVG